MTNEEQTCSCGSQDWETEEIDGATGLCPDCFFSEFGTVIPWMEGSKFYLRQMQERALNQDDS